LKTNTKKRSAGERKKFARRSSIGERPDADEEEKLDKMLDEEDALFGGAANVISSESDDVIFFSNWNTALFVQVNKNFVFSCFLFYCLSNL
jgi:hypothetical protein